MSQPPLASLTFHRGIIAILLGGIAIGSAAIFMRLAPVAPSAAAFWRMALSVPVLAIFVMVSQGRSGFALKNRTEMTAVIAVGVWFAADLFFWHWSVARTTVANATLLANLASVFTVIVGVVFLKERYSRLFLLGLAVALSGAGFLVSQNITFNRDYLFGDMLGIITALALTGYLITAAKARASISAQTVMLWSALVSAAALAPIALLADGDFIPASIEGWWPLIGLAVVTHALGQGLIMYGLAHVPAAFGAIGLLVQPIVAALLAALLFGEALAPLQWLGGVLILSGIVMTRRAR